MSLLRIKQSELASVNLINTKSGSTGDNMYKEYNPTYMINAGLYDMATHTNIVLLEDENKADGYYFADNGMGITQDNAICWCSYKEAIEKASIKDYISGAPVLVEKGIINISWGNKVSTQIQGKHMRSAVGFNKDEVILYCSDDSITLNTLANRMKSYGCEYAINLDGGGSQYLRDEKTTYKRSTRQNKTWLLFFKKQEEIKEVENMANYKVTASALNIRSGAGTKYSVVGQYKKNTEVTITEQKSGWGKTNKGWISMQYVISIQKVGATCTSVIRDIGYLHPEVQKICNKLLDKCAEEGLKVGLFETYRSDERQKYLYTQGSTTLSSTGAHGFCVAFDIVAKDDKGNWTWDTSNKTTLNTYKRVGEIGKSLGLEWGGDWTTLVDLPHFQYLGGVSIANYRKGKRPTWWNNWVIGTLQPIQNPTIEEKDNAFKDQPSDWALASCKKAAEKKLIEGDGQGNYGWSNNLTLERFIVILDKLGLIDNYTKK